MGALVQVKPSKNLLELNDLPRGEALARIRLGHVLIIISWNMQPHVPSLFVRSTASSLHVISFEAAQG